MASEPEALLALLEGWPAGFRRIGLEAGVLSQWLWRALAEAGLPVICVETRRMHAMLKAHNGVNKTDRNDARGIAQMMRAGLFRPVHVKTLRSQKLRMLLTHRKLLKAKALDVENDLRATLRNFGLKVGVVSAGRFEARIRELAAGDPDLAAMVEPMLVVRRTLREQFAVLHKRLLAIARDDALMQRLMTVPGVGAVVALGYVARRGAAAGPRLAVRRRDHAGAALRGGPGDAVPVAKMVLAEGVGDEDRAAARRHEGDRRAGQAAGRRHAPEVGGRHDVPGFERRSSRAGLKQRFRPDGRI